MPRRIVSLAPSVTESLFAVGAGGAVAAVTTACNHPQAAKRLPKIGDVTIDYERLLALHPDLVVTEAGLNAEALTRLASFHVPVVVLKNHTFSDLVASFRLLGIVTGMLSEGEREARRVEREFAAIRARVSRVSKRPLVYLEIWEAPLMTAGRGTFLDAIIELAGGENLGGRLLPGFPEISSELVLRQNPDVIVVTSVGVHPEHLKRRPGWERLSAFRRGRVHVIDPDILVRPGPRLPEGAWQLFRWFHPELRS